MARTFRTIAVLVIIISLLAGCSPSNQANSTQRGRNAQMRAVPVEVKPAEQKDFGLTFSLSGRVEANQQVDAPSKQTGKVSQVFVRVGDLIKAGQPIVQLDGEEIHIQLQRSQAALLSAKSRYEDAKKGTQEESLAQTQNLLVDLENKYKMTKRDLERSEKLFTEGAISQDEVENARLQASSALTTLENQKQKLKLDQKGPTQSTIDAAKAQVMQAEADLSLSSLNAKNLVIKAPIDGIIATLPVSVGESVSNGKVIAQIVDTSVMKVKTQVDESKVGLFQNGQSVDIEVSAVGVKTKGKIVSVSPVADSSRSYPLEIEIPNTDGKIRVGMIASAETKGEQRKALVVPREAVIFKEQSYFVFTVEDNKAKQVKVEVGESDGERIEILKGLKPGAQVIVKGQNMLVSDADVTVIDPNKKEQAPAGQQKKRQPGQNQPGQGQPGQGQPNQGQPGQSQPGQKG